MGFEPTISIFTVSGLRPTRRPSPYNKFRLTLRCSNLLSYLPVKWGEMDLNHRPTACNALIAECNLPFIFYLKQVERDSNSHWLLSPSFGDWCVTITLSTYYTTFQLLITYIIIFFPIYKSFI